MRWLVLVACACGGGGGAQKPPEAPKPVATNTACVQAYGEYEARWRTARSEELLELDFDQASTDEVIAIEVALLPTSEDLVKLRNQYTAVSVFLPDAPWPRALDAAEAAIAVCGEEAPKPT
jgi:hypothetical protein